MRSNLKAFDAALMDFFGALLNGATIAAALATGADRDAAVAVMQHSAPWLPVLLALSASSPFWHSEDTGYASSRTLAWHRWPTAGPGPKHPVSDRGATGRGR